MIEAKQSLTGDILSKGDKGERGYSAYEVYKNNGGTLSETEWLASLKGDKGDKGDKGEAGATYTAGENITIDENNVISATGGGLAKLYSCFCERKCSVGGSFYLQSYDTVKNMLKEAIENYVNNQVVPICSFNFPTNNRIQYIANLKGSLYVQSSSTSFPNEKQNYFFIDSDRFVINQYIYYYSIQITGSWTDNKFTVTQVYCSPYKNRILSSDFTPASEQYVDNKPTTYTGYDATKTQVLKNVNGTLTWVDE